MSRHSWDNVYTFVDLYCKHSQLLMDRAQTLKWLVSAFYLSFSLFSSPSLGYEPRGTHQNEDKWPRSRGAHPKTGSVVLIHGCFLSRRINGKTVRDIKEKGGKEEIKDKDFSSLTLSYLYVSKWYTYNCTVLILLVLWYIDITWLENQIHLLIYICYTALGSRGQTYDTLLFELWFILIIRHIHENIKLMVVYSSTFNSSIWMKMNCWCL